MNLDSGDILYGIAGSSGVYCAVFGDFRAGQIGQAVTNSFKPLFKGALPTSTTALVTISNAQQAILKEMQFKNANASEVVVMLYLSQTSTPLRVFTLPANGSAGYVDGEWTTYDSTGIPISTLIPLSYPIQVGQGGTGDTTLTQYGFLMGNGTNPVQVSAAPTDGQLMVGQTGGFSLPLSLSGVLAPLTAAGLTAFSAIAGNSLYANNTSGSAALVVTAYSAIPLSAWGAATADISMGGFKVTNAAAAIAGTDLPNLTQVLNLIATNVHGWLQVQTLSTVNVNIAAPGATIGGYSPNVGDTAQLTAQTTGSQNGPWVFNGAAVPMTRPADYASGATIRSGFTVVIGDGSSAGYISILSTDNVTVDTTATVWSNAPAIGYTGTAPISVAGSVISLNIGAGLTTTTGNLVIANTAVTAASYGSPTQVGTFTVGADGRLTAAANVTISGTAPGGAAGGVLSGTYPNPGFAIPAYFNANATTLPIGPTGTIIEAGNADGTATRITSAAFGAAAYFSAVAYGGTNAARTALTSGTQIGGYNSWGYNGSALTGPVATLRTFAAENWTGSVNGAYAEIAVTPPGQTTEITAMRFGGTSAALSSVLAIALATSQPILGIQAAASQTAAYQRTFDSSGNVLMELAPVSSSNALSQLWLYNTSETTPTNYERVSLYFDNPNNVARLETQNGGTGTLRNLALQAGGGVVLIGTNAAPLASTAVIQTLYATGTITGTSGTAIGTEYLETYSPSANSSATVRSLVMSLQPNTANNSTGAISGGAFEVRVINSGTMSQVNGAIFNGLILSGTAVSMGNVALVIGGQFQGVNSFSNSVAATVAVAHGIQVSGSGGGSLTITGQSGINIASLTLATNNTHLLIGQTTIPTGNFGIYNVSANNNYLAGNTGHGSGLTAPTSKIHIAAGTATAGTSPLKYTSGTLLTTPEVGAREFLTDKTYITITTGTARKELALWDIAGTSGRVPFETTNGRLTDSANLAYTSGTGLLVADNIKLTTAGNGIYIKEGSNATMGTGTLAAGTVTINTTKVTASSRVFLTDTGGGVLANIGSLYVSAKSAGVSFTVSSSNALDSSTFNWVILEPA